MSPHDGNYGPKSTDAKGIFGRTCPCRTEFRTNHPFQRYCSPTCKRQAQNRRYYQRHGDQVRAKSRQYQRGLRSSSRNDPAE